MKVAMSEQTTLPTTPDQRERLTSTRWRLHEEFLEGKDQFERWIKHTERDEWTTVELASWRQPTAKGDMAAILEFSWLLQQVQTPSSTSLTG